MKTQKYLVRYANHLLSSSTSPEERKFIISLDWLYENVYFAIYKITDSQEMEFYLNNYKFATIEDNRETILSKTPTSIVHIIEELI